MYLIVNETDSLTANLEKQNKTTRHTDSHSHRCPAHRETHPMHVCVYIFVPLRGLLELPKQRVGNSTDELKASLVRFLGRQDTALKDPD